MGAIADLIRAGVSRDIVVPIIPWDMSLHGDGESRGKAPAYMNAVGGWTGLDWIKGGLNADWLRRTDENGGNAGIILCAANGSESDNLQFLAIDIDFDKRIDGKDVKWRNAVVKLMRDIIGVDLQVRETMEQRCLFLVGLPAFDIGGPKKKFLISWTDPKTPRTGVPEDVGAFELLARGQQFVATGKHWSGNRIQWFKQTASGPGNEVTPAPDITAIPVAQNYDEAVNWIVALLETMAPFGFTYRVIGAHEEGQSEAPELAMLAAPSIGMMVNLLEQTPNPATVDRDIYVNFMFAVGGARAGLKEVKGALSSEEEIALANAISAWASKWEAPAGKTAGSFESEYRKWMDDFVRPRDDYYSGWRQMARYAAQFGAPHALLQHIASEAARDEFQADNGGPPPADIVPGPNVLKADEIQRMSGFGNNLADESDQKVAFTIISQLTGLLAWVPNRNNWMVWEGLSGWRMGETSNDICVNEIRTHVADYVLKYGQGNPAIGVAGWSASTHTRMLSAKKVTDVTKFVKGYLHKSSDEIDLGRAKLQTPMTMVDLETGLDIELMQRKALMETRATSVIPSKSNEPTPYFDRLVMGLCDENEEVANWLLHYIGYCLLGNPREAVFLVIYGSGGNGKSTFGNVLTRTLGEYAVSIAPHVIQANGKDKHPASLMKLHGKRLAIISEPDRYVAWDERALKALTGGDEIEARWMRANPVTFRSNAGLIILSNNLPSFDRAEPAIQRRFRLIKTVRRRTNSEIIPDLEERILKQESPYVLRRLINYAMAVGQAGALPILPTAMSIYANETLAEHDMIFGWLQAECEYGTPDTANSEEEIRVLKERCELFIRRRTQEQGSGFTADKLNDAEFSARLIGEGISLSDDKILDKNGKPRRHSKTIQTPRGAEKVYTARGVRLKLKLMNAV
jgi:putative DNA primase/helicase